MNALVIRDGSSQAMRALPALQDGYFNLDEMSFPELLAMATDFAALVRFVNEQNQPDGDWSAFFHADETVVMSRILAFDMHAAVAGFDAWWRGTPEHAGGARHAAWGQASLPVAELARTIDGWYRALQGVSTDNGLSLRVLIENVIVQLGADRSGLLAQLEREGMRAQLSEIWLARPAGADGEAPAHAALSKTVVRADFHAYLKAVEMIRKEARARLPASLLNQRHDPAVAMLIAFVRQFQKLQGKLNRFTRNYLDFYYDRMLGSAPLPAMPDRAWLVLRKSPALRAVMVPADTEFQAGLDERGHDILYVATGELGVSDARVCALQTLYFDHDRYSSPEKHLHADGVAPDTPGARTWPTSAWFSQPPVVEADAAPDALQAHPALGAPKSRAARSAAADARIGFALASKVLLLKEGLRRITVRIQFEDDTLMRRLESLATATRAASGPAQQDEGDAREEIRRQDIFLKVFRRIFSVAITGEHGWIELPDYLPWYDGATLRLTFELPPQAPSVVAYQPALHGENLEAATPLMRFVINPSAYLYPYGMLRDLPISGAVIEVEALGCRDLVLHNNIGQLSAAAPFAPFGPLPRLGSYLVVGSTEMAGKRISSFSVEVEWADLPRGNGGFTSYYDAYGQPIGNQDFLASVGVLAKGGWTPPSEQARPTLPLFRSEVQPGRGERLVNRVLWNADMVAHLFEPDEGVSVAKPLTYGPGAKNGFFKFTLAAPAFAFGHEQYPQVLSATLMQNARARRLQRQRPVPPAPYTPQINAIAINYGASSSIHIDRKTTAAGDAGEQFIHLYPSGWERLGVASYPAPALLPRFDFSGNLYIGIEAGELGSVLTLLFHLREDSLPLPADDAAPARPGEQPAGLHWFYLAGNTWKALPKNCLIADGTQQFMRSGIVTLQLPADIGADNSVMPAGSYWLRISADRDLEKYCSLYAVHAQAMEAQRGPEVPASASMVLPAGSISRSRRPLPGIVRIMQPAPSVGGRAAETRGQLRIRMSERLRHKNRAVSAADYEALILQYFPEVYKVKCFANLATDRGPSDCIRPGHVLVVPLPYWPALKHLEQMPMLNGNLMHEIRSFLQGLASPWSRMSVENPVYEKIQVRCKVKFRGPLGQGYYIRELNQAISDFLTPWQDGHGYRIHFGWRIRRHDVEALIGGLPYVESVTGFSMLRVASPDTLTYSLFDTAAQGGAGGDDDITPLCPWSIAIPALRHAIEAVDDAVPSSATRTALSRLEIGSTFIIGTDQHDQQINGPA